MTIAMRHSNEIRLNVDWVGLSRRDSMTIRVHHPEKPILTFSGVSSFHLFQPSKHQLLRLTVLIVPSTRVNQEAASGFVEFDSTTLYSRMWMRVVPLCTLPSVRSLSVSELHHHSHRTSINVQQWFLWPYDDRVMTLSCRIHHAWVEAWRSSQSSSKLSSKHSSQSKHRQKMRTDRLTQLPWWKWHDRIVLTHSSLGRTSRRIWQMETDDPRPYKV